MVTTEIKKEETACDTCSRSISKATRVYDGKRFCPTCYKRVFRPTTCTACGKKVRTPGGSAGLCRICSTGDRHCIRCGRHVAQAALVKQEGVVCPSCAPFFKAAASCAYCGKQSIHLSRDARLGFTEPACPTCRRKDHINCTVCGKNRRTGGILPDGRTVCGSCFESAGAQFCCPTCGRTSRKHSSNRCELCYWEKRLQSKLQIEATAGCTNWAWNTYQEFCQDLAAEIGAKKTVLRMPKYREFFRRLAVLYPDCKSMGVFSLVKHFGLEGLRRASIPYGFLIKSGMLPDHSDHALKSAHEENRQQEALARCLSESFYPVLKEYLDWLMTINRRHALSGWTGTNSRFVSRTVTSNLLAAEKLMRWQSENGKPSTYQYDDDSINSFVTEHPGYSTGLQAFARFVNHRKKSFQRIKVISVARNLPRGLILNEDKRTDLICKLLEPEDKNLKEALILLLMLLYAQPGKAVVLLKVSDVRKAKDSDYEIRLTDQWLTLDCSVGKLLSRYLSMRDVLHCLDNSKENPYLFPGRRHSSHLTCASVTGYLKKHAVSGASLFSSGVYYLFQHGAAHPAALVDGLGMRSGTAFKYYKISNMTAQEELSWQNIDIPY